MKKRILTIVLACALVLSLFAACAGTDGTKATKEPASTGDTAGKTTEPEATKAGDPTAAPTAEPTEEPTEKPTAEPKPTLDTGVEAILVDFEDESSYSGQACLAELDDDGIWLNIVTDIGDNNITFTFPQNFSSDNYPFIAFKYRLGFAQSVRNTNHFYSITTEGGPAGEPGKYADIEWVSDTDWHVGKLDLKNQFNTAVGDWVAIRFPTADNIEGDLAIAWLGAFKSEEDITKYDEAFNKAYGAKLVKAEEPDLNDKEELVPEFEDSFGDVALDFEDYNDGDGMGAAFFDYFYYSVGANQSAIVDVDGNLVGKISFDALSYDGLVKKGAGYTATFDIKNEGGSENFGGFVFNWGDEKNTSRNFYENNGLESDSSGSLTGNSGCGVFLQGNKKIKVYIPVWDTEANKKSYISATLDTEVDFNAAFVKVVVEDNGTDTVTVTADGKLLFSVKYADPGVNAKAVGFDEAYYRSVKILDGAGNELCASESSLFSVYKSISWAGRSHTIYVDNIQIADKK